MSILSRLPCSAMFGSVICDYLNVTVPVDDADSLRDALHPIVEALGPFETFSEGWRLSELRGGKLVPAGTLKLYRRGQVTVCSASGQVLHRLRITGLLGSFLGALAALPHRVSMLHATADYLASGPDYVQAVYSAAKTGDLSLTRKKLKPANIRAFLGPDDSGSDTGTIYLGQRKNADVWAKVYDKRAERISAGYPDPGPMVRVEVAIQSDVGATLRDASDPFSIFFQFAGRSLVEVPPEWSIWEAHGEGYVVPQRVQRTLFERMESIVAHSLDIGRLVGFALESSGWAEEAALKALQVVLRPSVRSAIKAREVSL